MKKELANIAVFVSGGGTNLQAILDAIDKGIIVSGKVTLVVSNKKERALFFVARLLGARDRT